jgi:hypothetical protein
VIHLAGKARLAASSSFANALLRVKATEDMEKAEGRLAEPVAAFCSKVKLLSFRISVAQNSSNKKGGVSDALIAGRRSDEGRYESSGEVGHIAFS